MNLQTVLLTGWAAVSLTGCLANPLSSGVPPQDNSASRRVREEAYVHFCMGAYYEANQDLDSALVEYKKVLAVDPEAYEAVVKVEIGRAHV